MRSVLVLTVLLSMHLSASSQTYQRFFTEKTMRVDYNHTVRKARRHSVLMK